MTSKISLLLFIIAPQLAVADTISYSSSEEQTTMIELYTSEGCSSCPPADEFLSQFKNSDELWQKYIPLAFHVDYWDYIGWKDVFASPGYSQRQRTHKQQGNLSSVYTPGFLVNGKEWPGFFKPWRSIPEFDAKPGSLKIQIEGPIVTIEFPSTKDKIKYNMAIVGIGLETVVNAGENNGHRLPHDFVVLDHQSRGGQKSVSFNLPLIVNHDPKQFAIIAWVTSSNSIQPIQTTGGYLPDGMIKRI